MRGKTLKEQVEEWNRQSLATNNTQAQQARKTNPTIPPPTPGIIPLGVLMDGSSFPEWVGVYPLANSWVGIDAGKLQEHTLIIGETGTGKSVTISFLIEQLARHTNADIFVIDGKGDLDFCLNIANIIYRERGTKVPLSLIGHNEPGSVYDSFRGSADAIYNRLAELIDIAELEGNATHFREMYRVMMRLVCMAPQGPPRSLEELDERMSLDWCATAWRSSTVHTRNINRLKHYEKDLSALTNRIASLWMTFERYMGPEGFALEDSHAGVFCIKKLSIGDDAPRFMDFFISDVGDFISNRMKRPAVLIIDEFGAFGNQNVKPLLMQGRSHELSVLLATQTPASLGTMVEREEFLSLCNNIFLMSSKFPEQLIEVAGTVQRLEGNLRHVDGQLTRDGTLYTRRQFRIDPDEVRGLQPGQGFLLRKNLSWKIQVKLPEPVTHTPEAIITYHKDPPQTPVNKTPIKKMEMDDAAKSK